MVPVPTVEKLRFRFRFQLHISTLKKQIIIVKFMSINKRCALISLLLWYWIRDRKKPESGIIILDTQDCFAQQKWTAEK
jgi:hypothetical protein